MNKFETKYQNSAKLMDQALIELLNDKDFEYITVKEICKKAGVNRSTFYLHYETIDELLSETCQWYLEKFYEYYNNLEDRISVKDIDKMNIDDLILTSPKYLIPYLTFIKENKKIMTACVSKPGLLNCNKIYDDMFDHIVKPIMERFSIPKEDMKYIYSYFVNGINALIGVWIQNGFKESIEHISQLIVNMIPKHAKHNQ